MAVDGILLGKSNNSNTPFKKIEYTGGADWSTSNKLTFTLECEPTYLMIYYNSYNCFLQYFKLEDGSTMGYIMYNGNGPVLNIQNGYIGGSNYYEMSVTISGKTVTLVAPYVSGRPPYFNGGGAKGIILYY